MISEIGRAKINLYLHVGPVRADGLHELASLFVFTEDGDEVSAAPGDDLTLHIDGPFADALAGFDPSENLVMVAARALRERAGVQKGASLRLCKNLPVAAGIGGGSADAAAALRALQRLWDVRISENHLHELAFILGADVPACLSGAPSVVGGAGEVVAPSPPLPTLYACLVNPRVEMPTGPVFRAFDAANPAPPPPTHPALVLSDVAGVAGMMSQTRNDLEAAAKEIEPALITKVISLLAQQPGALAARMSGSGATCFALFAEARQAAHACAAAEKMSWWAMASRLASG